MTLAMRQIKLNCPSCGEFLWRAFTITYVLGKAVEETREEEPACSKCRPRHYLDLLRNARIIEPLTKEVHEKGDPFGHGEKIIDMTGARKPPDEPESD